jgi:hypothetical protein
MWLVLSRRNSDLSSGGFKQSVSGDWAHCTIEMIIEAAARREMDVASLFSGCAPRLQIEQRYLARW